MPIVVGHAGSASRPAHEDGPRLACAHGLEIIARQKSALEAAVAATRCLEDDERFNTGIGSNVRLDGSIQMDASCMTSGRAFGACWQRLTFCSLVRVPQRLLGGPGLSKVTDRVDVGLIVADGTGFAVGARHGMVWHGQST